MAKKDTTEIVSSPIVYKGVGKKRKWLLVKEEEGADWSFPTAVTRATESSVRTAIRTMGDKGGMTVKILAEAGRSGGVTKIGERVVPVRHLFYTAFVRSQKGEEIGFLETTWLPYLNAIRTLQSKRDRDMLKAARDSIQVLKKAGTLDKYKGEEEEI